MPHYLLQQYLQASAQRFPDKDAVIFKNQHLTYHQLDALSDRLATVLRAHGVGKGDRVGFYLNKSLFSVIAIYGILKAEAAYVPLDPMAPPKRLAFIVADCEMKALITTPRKAAALAGVQSQFEALACVIFTENGSLDSPLLAGTARISWEEVQTTSPEPWAYTQIENDLAYILYTSGSTGVPKGVMISHRASLTFVNWCVDKFAMRPEDRVSNHAPFHFDLSTFDLFASIEVGATVVLVPEGYSVFPMMIADFIAKEEISIWYSVPSVLTSLVLHANLAERSFPHLRIILFAGEVFPVNYLRQLMSLIPDIAYYNLYGPTETNVCTYYKTPLLAPDRVEPISIGKACENTEVFAVTEDGRLAEVGEVGELYVRGPSLLSGYWGLPDKTAAVLVPDPIHTLWDQKAYRTGDLVRLNPDGNYTFLGRRDHQIKSRGYRIEIGEIEAALYSHPEVVEAVVIPLPDPEIGNFIKALVTTTAGSQLTARALDQHCAGYIPKYMLPGAIEFRDSLPKTSTGKIDRTLLRQSLLAELEAQPG